jgi:hypothetical protein
MRTQSSDVGRLNPGKCLLVFSKQGYDRQLMGFGKCLEGVELFQFLGDNFLEGRGNRTLLNIDLLAGKVFKPLHGLSQRLEAH